MSTNLPTRRLIPQWIGRRAHLEASVTTPHIFLQSWSAQYVYLPQVTKSQVTL